MRVLICLVSVSCAGSVVTRTGFGGEADNFQFFAHCSSANLRAAFDDVCPSVRAALDYRAFGESVLANPYLRFNGGFAVWKATSFGRGGTGRETGWLSTLSGSIEADLHIGHENGKLCLLGGQIAGSPLLPAFSLKGAAPPDAKDFLRAEALVAALQKRTLVGVNRGGVAVRIEYLDGGKRKARITMPSNEQVEDTGTWRVVDDRVCGTYQTINRGLEHCFRYIARGTNELEVYDEEGFLTGNLQAQP